MSEHHVVEPEEGDEDQLGFAASPKKQKQAKITEISHRLEIENDVRAIVGSAEGRRLLVRIMDICGRNSTPFNPNNSVMCEIAGRRSVAFQIENMIRDVDHALWQALDVELEKSRPKPDPIPTGKIKP